MGNKEWDLFIRETVRGYMATALRYNTSFEEAEDIVWGVYARLLEKDYLQEEIQTIGLKAVHNASINLSQRKPFRRDSEILRPPPSYQRPMAKMDADTILRKIDELSPPREKTVFLSYINGMVYKEIAEFHNISVGAVKSHISRARKRIRNEYKEYAKL